MVNELLRTDELPQPLQPLSVDCKPSQPASILSAVTLPTRSGCTNRAAGAVKYFLLYFYKTDELLTMKATVKSASQPIKLVTTKKPDEKPKVKLGTGRNVVFMSDTLFDDDLKS